MPAPPLSELLLARLSDARRAEAALGDRVALEAALVELTGRVRDARLACPPDERALVEHLAARLPDEGDLVEQLHQLNVEDLALAWGCARGHAAAIAELEQRCFSAVDAALARLPDTAAQRQDIKQLLRQRLFIGADGRAPRIAQYSGRGALTSWLRVAAIRCALNLLQKQGREVALHDELLGDASAPENAELLHLKQRYRGEFKRAFEQALASLTSRERNVLSYTYLERLTAHQLGAIYGVHRTTVARWLSTLRQTLADRTHAALMTRLRVDSDELASIMRLINSQLDASIERFLLQSQGSGDSEP